MTRVLNAIDPATAADIRAAISGKPNLKVAKPKRVEGVKATVSQFHKFDPRTDTHTVQLAIVFRTAEYNTSRTPQWLKEKWVKEKREHVWTALFNYLPRWCNDPSERERVYAMEFLRYGRGKLDARDNLRSAFKPVVDATCAFLVWGSALPADKRAIGTADRKIEEQRGVEWNYRQMQCPANPRAYGIQIILHCRPRADVPSPDFESSPTS
jgi:hypothetical protein